MRRGGEMWQRSMAGRARLISIDVVRGGWRRRRDATTVARRRHAIAQFVVPIVTRTLLVPGIPFRSAVRWANRSRETLRGVGMGAERVAGVFSKSRSGQDRSRGRVRRRSRFRRRLGWRRDLFEMTLVAFVHGLAHGVRRAVIPVELGEGVLRRVAMEVWRTPADPVQQRCSVVKHCGPSRVLDRPPSWTVCGGTAGTLPGHVRAGGGKRGLTLSIDHHRIRSTLWGYSHILDIISRGRR